MQKKHFLSFFLIIFSFISSAYSMEHLLNGAGCRSRDFPSYDTAALIEGTATCGSGLVAAGSSCAYGWAPLTYWPLAACITCFACGVETVTTAPSSRRDRLEEGTRRLDSDRIVQRVVRSRARRFFDGCADFFRGIPSVEALPAETPCARYFNPVVFPINVTRAFFKFFYSSRAERMRHLFAEDRENRKNLEEYQVLIRRLRSDRSFLEQNLGIIRELEGGVHIERAQLERFAERLDTVGGEINNALSHPHQSQD